MLLAASLFFYIIKQDFGKRLNHILVKSIKYAIFVTK